MTIGNLVKVVTVKALKIDDAHDVMRGPLTHDFLRTFNMTPINRVSRDQIAAHRQSIERRIEAENRPGTVDEYTVIEMAIAAERYIMMYMTDAEFEYKSRLK